MIYLEALELRSNSRDNSPRVSLKLIRESLVAVKWPTATSSSLDADVKIHIETDTKSEDHSA
jgi:hypothetical protein